MPSAALGEDENDPGEKVDEGIALCGLLYSLSVRPVRDGQGQETDTFEVPADGRRL